MAIETLNQMFKYAVEQHGDTMYFGEKDSNKVFQNTLMKDLYTKAQNLAIALKDLGLKPKDRVGLIADNCTNWALADFAVLMNGAADVPRGTDSTTAEIEYILNHSGAKICFFHDEKTYNTMKPILKKTSVTDIIIMDPKYQAKGKNIYNIEDLAEKGSKKRDKALAAIEQTEQL